MSLCRRGPISARLSIIGGLSSERKPLPCLREFSATICKRELQNAAELERVRQDTERLLIENEQRRRQLQESRRRSELEAQQEAARKQSDIEVINKWFSAAQPRMHLYADFREKVFAPDLRLTISMIQFISESRYAADIAYFLGGDKKTTLQTSLMEVSAARA